MLNYNFLLIALAFFFIACSGNQENNEEGNPGSGENIIEVTQDQIKSIGLEISDLEKRNISAGISVNGYLDTPPQHKATVSSIVGGRILQIRFLPGDYVQKGQWVVRIESPDFLQLQRDYIQAESEVMYLENEYERQEKLSEKNVNALKTFLQAERDLTSKKAELNTMKDRLRLLGINAEKITPEDINSTLFVRSPINGFISEIYTMLGKYIHAEDDLFRVVNPEHLHAELNVYEKDILQVHKGQQVEMRFPQNPDTVYNGEIFLVGKELNRNSRSVNVHVHIPENKEWAVGMYIEGRILTQFREVFVVPSEALIRQESGSFVYLVDSRENNTIRLKKVEVETGVEQEGFIEVTLQGIQPENVQIASRGVYYLDSQ